MCGSVGYGGLSRRFRQLLKDKTPRVKTMFSYIDYLDELPKATEEKIHQGHISDEAQAGIVCNYKRFSLAAKDKTDIVMGILTAFTAFAEVYVDDIWVDPAYRKLGIGKKLLLELEHRFQDKGYNNINLVTSEFQAPGFYEKCGFELEFVRVNKQNPQLTKYFFIKFFDKKDQHQGLLSLYPSL